MYSRIPGPDVIRQALVCCIGRITRLRATALGRLPNLSWIEEHTWWAWLQKLYDEATGMPKMFEEHACLAWLQKLYDEAHGYAQDVIERLGRTAAGVDAYEACLARYVMAECTFRDRRQVV